MACVILFGAYMGLVSGRVGINGRAWNMAKNAIDAELVSCHKLFYIKLTWPRPQG